MRGYLDRRWMRAFLLLFFGLFVCMRCVRPLPDKDNALNVLLLPVEVSGVAGYSLGGTVHGLTGSGLVLRLGSESLTIHNAGDFTFATGLADGTDYSVSVAAQPTGPAQFCTLGGGSGRIEGAAVTDLALSCFGPADLSGLRNWLDAGAGITIGTGVSAWNDQSGSGTGVSQATPTEQPAYVSSGGPAGKAYVSFDGTDDFMAGTAFSFTGRSVFLVLRRVAWGGVWSGVLSYYNGANPDWGHEDAISMSNNGAGFYGSNRQVGADNLMMTGSTAAPSGNFELLSHTFGGGNAHYYLDGILAASDTYSDLNSVDPTGYVLASRWPTGVVGEYGAIDFAEIVAYDRLLTDSERQAVECYLQKRYELGTTSC